ncbi:hypothetical protein SpCBS45565_g07646 [Spizellomyces sp. 'palustris']|nr:hypothetical protein SpCBS45565_g07646 [Spizellomyces sp. 'palustris']
MKASLSIAALAASISVVVAQAPTNNLQSCVPAGQYNAAYDYFPEKAVIADPTSNIKISYRNSYKIVTNTVSKTSYVLYQCGTPAPANETGHNGTFAVPVSTIAIADTTSITYLELLGVRDRIKVSTSTDFTTSPCVQKMQADKTLSQLNTADPAAGTAMFNSVNMTLGFGDPAAMNSTTYVDFPATTDAGALHRSQYLLYLSAFFNRETLGTKLTGDISGSYNCLKDVAAKSAKANGTPRVAWIYQYQGNYTINSAPYLVEYTNAAGGSVISNTTKYTDRTAFAQALKDVDVVIDLSLGVNDMKAFTEAYGGAPVTDQKFFTGGQVWSVGKRVNGLSGYDWFESAVVNEHIVVADLVSILQPALLGNKYQRTYFKNLKEEQTVKLTADQCPNAAAALDLPTVSCPTEVPTGSGVKANSAMGRINYSQAIVVAAAFVAIIFAM